jgi:hypothetical protein
MSITKIPLSGSTSGKTIQLDAAQNAYTTIHTCSATANVLSEVTLVVETNICSKSMTYEIEVGGTTTKDVMTVVVPAGANRAVILDRYPLQNGMVVKAKNATPLGSRFLIAPVQDATTYMRKLSVNATTGVLTSDGNNSAGTGYAGYAIDVNSVYVAKYNRLYYVMGNQANASLAFICEILCDDVSTATLMKTVNMGSSPYQANGKLIYDEVNNCLVYSNASYTSLGTTTVVWLDSYGLRDRDDYIYGNPAVSKHMAAAWCPTDGKWWFASHITDYSQYMGYNPNQADPNVSTGSGNLAVMYGNYFYGACYDPTREIFYLVGNNQKFWIFDPSDESMTQQGTTILADTSKKLPFYVEALDKVFITSGYGGSVASCDVIDCTSPTTVEGNFSTPTGTGNYCSGVLYHPDVDRVYTINNYNNTYMNIGAVGDPLTTETVNSYLAHARSLGLVDPFAAGGVIVTGHVHEIDNAA